MATLMRTSTMPAKFSARIIQPEASKSHCCSLGSVKETLDEAHWAFVRKAYAECKSKSLREFNA